MEKSKPTAQDIALRQEFLTFDSCLISDVLEKLGLPGGVTGIVRQATDKRIFGPTVTVTLQPFDGTIHKRHLGTKAIDLGEVGDIIVVQHTSRADCAGWGGLLSTAAKLKGIGGVVVDGLVRDIDESEDLGLPVFSRGVTPVTARNRVSETATNEDVLIGGVTVTPGDYVLADGSGIAFIPRDRLMEVAEAARGMLAVENGIRAALVGGVPISDAMNQTYETLLKKS